MVDQSLNLIDIDHFHIGMDPTCGPNLDTSEQFPLSVWRQDLVCNIHFQTDSNPESLKKNDGQNRVSQPFFTSQWMV